MPELCEVYNMMSGHLRKDIGYYIKQIGDRLYEVTDYDRGVLVKTYNIQCSDSGMKITEV